MTEEFVGGYAKIMIKEGTPAQKRAAKLAGAKKQFPSGLYVCGGATPDTCGNVTGYRLKGFKVEVKIGSRWYPKSEVTKNNKTIRAIMRARG